MRDHLHGAAEILALAFLVEHVPVHAAGREIRELVQVLVDKALIVAKIQIGLRAVLRYKHLAVLIGAHGARIHVHIWVELLCRHAQAARFEQTAQRGRRNSLAQTGNHAACHKDILRHLSVSSIVFLHIFRLFLPQKEQGFAVQTHSGVCLLTGNPFPCFS